METTAAAAIAISVISRSALSGDAQKALGEVESDKQRPNARNPKPFENDGRGGSQTLPATDNDGRTITYTEHTVNPREPGQSLDGKRLVVGSDGSVYYTDDHFTTFQKVDPAKK